VLRGGVGLAVAERDQYFSYCLLGADSPPYPPGYRQALLSRLTVIAPFQDACNLKLRNFSAQIGWNILVGPSAGTIIRQNGFS